MGRRLPCLCLLCAACSPEYSPEQLLPAISASPDSVDLGQLSPSDIAEADVRIANIGRGGLLLYDVMVTSPFSVEWSEESLEPGAEISLPLGFSAAEESVYGGTLSIHSNDPDRPWLQIPLAAERVLPDILVIPEEFVLEGEGGPMIEPLYIVNEGRGTLVVASMALETDRPDLLSLEGDGEGFHLDPDSVQSPELTWTGEADASGLIRILSDDPDEPEVEVPVTATRCGTWYEDADGDGHGEADSAQVTCDPASGLVELGDDCDDEDAATFPGAVEVDCEEKDRDCDGISTYTEDCEEEVDAALFTLQAAGAYEVDTSTAALTLVTSWSGMGNPTSAAIRADGVVFAYDVSPDGLWTVDLCTGSTHLLGATGMSTSGAIGFGADGQLYGVDGGSEELVILDQLTGAKTIVGSIGFDATGTGMASGPTGDLLLADSGSKTIFSFDLTTGAGTAVLSTDAPLDNVGFEYDPNLDLYWASTGYMLYQIDPVTGSSTWVGALGAKVNDLFLHPRCE